MIKLFRGFYPDVDIQLDWKMHQPNIYAYIEKDKKKIMISGGLVRMQELNAEGLTLLTAMCVGRFYGDEEAEVCAKGKAEFYAAAAITRISWYGNMWMNPTMEALRQVTELFQLISPENVQADLDDPEEGLAIWIT